MRARMRMLAWRRFLRVSSSSADDWEGGWREVRRLSVVLGSGEETKMLERELLTATGASSAEEEGVDQSWGAKSVENGVVVSAEDMLVGSGRLEVRFRKL